MGINERNIPLRFTVSKRKIFYALLVLFFLPISTSGGISANYSYILLFILCPLLPYRKIPPVAVALVFFSFLSYCRGMVFISEGESYFLQRQALSFFAFIVGVCLLFLRIPYSIDGIRKTVLVICTIYSAWTVIVVISQPQFDLTDLYYIKAGLRGYVPHWPQRFSVIIMFGFFCALLGLVKSKKYLVPFLLLLSCLFLTFTRSVYISVSAGLFIFLFQILFVLKKSKYPKIKHKLVVYSLFFLAGIFVIFTLDNSIQRNLIIIFKTSFNAISDFLAGNIVAGRDGSEAIRMHHWAGILDVWSTVPILGSGFANMYLFDSDIGSAHSQYLNVLLLTGLVGLLFYLFLWGRLFVYFWKSSPDIFSGLVAIFIYGLMNETTKLSYVGLLFFLLLNKVYEAKYYKPSKGGALRTKDFFSGPVGVQSSVNR